MFSRRAEHLFVFQFSSDFANVLLKANRGRGRRSNFVIFVVWSALVVGGWVIVGWSRKSSLVPAEITSFVFLVLLKDGGRTVNPRFHLFVSNVKGMRRRGKFKISLCDLKDKSILLRSFGSC